MPEAARQHGVLLVLSGPSGAGKSTVCARLLAQEPTVHFSVSCTTRAARAGEQHGHQYYFLSAQEFENRLGADAFLEYAEVHGERYGTLRSEVEPYLTHGRDVLLDIDVQGARRVRERLRGAAFAPAAVFVFFGPPSLAELERRLRERQTDSDEQIARRLRNAESEIRAWREYDFVVINRRVDTATADLRAILVAARCRTQAFYPPWTLPDA